MVRVGIRMLWIRSVSTRLQGIRRDCQNVTVIFLVPYILLAGLLRIVGGFRIAI